MLRTLRDAGEYIQALPRAKLKQPEWEIAAETLLAAVEGSGPLMFAEIAMRKVVNAEKSLLLNRHHVAGRRRNRALGDDCRWLRSGSSAAAKTIGAALRTVRRHAVLNAVTDRMASSARSVSSATTK
jgi:hypothetical protein